MFTCYLFPAVLCDSLMTVDNSTRNTSRHSYGEYVNVTCQKGHVFPDGDITKVTWCTENKTWSAELPDCSSKDIIYSKFLALIN